MCELSALIAENESLKRMLDDAVVVCPTDEKEKSKKDALLEINLQQVGVVFVVLKFFNE